MSEIGGVVHITRSNGQRTVVVTDSQVERFEHEVEDGWEIEVEDGDQVKKGETLAFYESDEETQEILAEAPGRIALEDNLITLIHEETEERDYDIPTTGRLLVEEGQRIDPGTQLIDGVLNPHDILRILGRESTENYLLREVQNAYRSQGVNINDKHFEIIFRKCLSKVQIVEAGDTEMLPGEMVDRLALEDANQTVIEAGGNPARGRPLLLGITKAALNTESFLSASSFQHTIRVLSGAAIEGKEDPLLGLKENVIIGKLIPAGTGYRGEGPSSSGPIESFEGVQLRKLEPEVEEKEEPKPFMEEPEAEAEVEEEAEVEAEAEAEGEEAEPKEEITSDILGISSKS
jgi:DNA-directed RNA polymerase subunit beta'